MADSKCSHCGKTSFELKTVEAQDSRYKHHFIQCGDCGTPFGVLEYHNIGVLFEQQKTILKQLQAFLKNLDDRLSSVERLLRSR